VRSFRQRLFDWLVVVSLVLLAATAVTCVVGALHPVMLRWESNSARVYFARLGGWRIILVEQNMTPPNAVGSFVLDATRFGGMTVKWGPPPMIASMGFDPANMAVNSILGFGVSTDMPGFILQDSRGTSVRVHTKVTVATAPYWPLIVMFSILPGIWWYARQRDCVRRQLGLCGVCGYDLRATPQRCPECGTVPAVTSDHAED
jgi:hypothetical protein